MILLRQKDKQKTRPARFSPPLPPALTTTPPVPLHPHPAHPITSHPAGVAFTTYATVGFFAAARYGLSTAGDILVNRWLPGRWDGLLDVLMAAYLAVR